MAKVITFHYIIANVFLQKMQDYFVMYDLTCLSEHINHQKSKELSTVKTNANLSNSYQQSEWQNYEFCLLLEELMYSRINDRSYYSVGFLSTLDFIGK